MKQLKRFTALLLLLGVMFTCLVACVGGGDDPTPQHQHVDYASNVTLDMSSTDTVKQKVTVKTYIDGDTTHFHVPTSVLPTGVLKARYIAINTPESTGKIEEWGKAASKFTKSKLQAATDIIIESDTATWNPDSTGDRYLVWVWYKTADMTEYRNLNIEILQEGLAIASNSSQNRYGSVCMDAINQAKVEKLHVNSGVKDPDFYYGEAIPVDLRELRTNIESYSGSKVQFEGVVTRNYNNGVYVENYDDETEMYYGMYVYYGFNLSGAGLEIISVGNRVSIVGSVQYYENGHSYQVSDISYRAMKPNDPNNIQKLDNEKHEPSYVETTADTFKNKKVTLTVKDEEGEDVEKQFSYAELALYTSVQFKNLVVKRASTTTNEESNSYGAITLYCEVGGIEVTVRTDVLYDENGELITQDMFVGKTIDVKGIIDMFYQDYTADFPYQIKVLDIKDVVIH